MPKALKLTEDNVDQIVKDAKSLGFDLSYLRDEMMFQADYGWDVYLITDGGAGSIRDITYTALPDAGFHQSWKFANGEIANQFAEITRV